MVGSCNSKEVGTIHVKRGIPGQCHVWPGPLKCSNSRVVVVMVLCEPQVQNFDTTASR
jgi:hypothetical protein